MFLPANGPKITFLSNPEISFPSCPKMSLPTFIPSIRRFGGGNYRFGGSRVEALNRRYAKSVARQYSEIVRYYIIYSLSLYSESAPTMILNRFPEGSGVFKLRIPPCFRFGTNKGDSYKEGGFLTWIPLIRVWDCKYFPWKIIWGPIPTFLL